MEVQHANPTHQALAEIKAVAKKEPVLAAEGAVLYLEKLAPAIEQVDSSSGSIGSAVNRAIEALVPKALAAAGKSAEAIRYAEDSKGLNAPLTAIAAFCEGVLLDEGFADEAYMRYAVQATYTTTNLATFKAVVKKYPHMPKETILRDLVASQPGQAGKSFAAAKYAGFFELAIELANRSPSDPRTLIRASRDFAVERPEFAMAAGMTALRGIANGWGYDITGVDVLDAYAAVMAAAGAAGVDETVVKVDVRAMIPASCSGGRISWTSVGAAVIGVKHPRHRQEAVPPLSVSSSLATEYQSVSKL
ncbi:hypothetical protein [Rugamonas sp.]|uniref:hypothetical protein n=1 Tax=Rugamonas sp. TaxID=1926287 RepID=UPI00345C5732